MGRSKPYRVAGQAFRSQADLQAAVHAALWSHPFNTEFRDDFMAAVINALNAECQAAGQRASGRFEFLDHWEQHRRGLRAVEYHRGGPLLRGWIEPLNQWVAISAYPWRKTTDPAQHLKLALRKKIAPYLPSPTAADRCARADGRPHSDRLEYQHVAPTFDVIARECLARMTADEIAARFGYSPFVPGRDVLAELLPDEHAAVRHLHARHQDNVWEWLCSGHHRNDYTAGTYSKAADVARTVAQQLLLPGTTA